MPKQDINIPRTTMQNTILDLEKKYFSILESIFKSENFLQDLLKIEKEIRENYPKFANTWNLKNKLKIPAERLIRHHIYTALTNLIKGIYPSPISSDIGILLEDCILCIDVKTLDTISNNVDIKSTSVEPNQISFKNTNHEYISSCSNLESIDHYSRRPVLTFVVKIIYTDDNYSFKLSRISYPSLIFTCIPNGELSNLFGNDIIKNFKTYNYYTISDNPAYAPIFVPSNIKSKKDKNDFTEEYCLSKNYAKVPIKTDTQSKNAYYDIRHKCIWWLTSDNNKAVIKAVKSGSTTRIENAILKERYDSHNEHWDGYKELPIPAELT